MRAVALGNLIHTKETFVCNCRVVMWYREHESTVIMRVWLDPIHPANTMEIAHPVASDVDSKDWFLDAEKYLYNSIIHVAYRQITEYVINGGLLQ